MPAQEVQLFHTAVTQLKETGQLVHPRVQGIGARSPPQLRKSNRKKRKKELLAQQLARHTTSRWSNIGKQEGTSCTQTAPRSYIQKLGEWEAMESTIVTHGMWPNPCPRWSARQTTGGTEGSTARRAEPPLAQAHTHLLRFPRGGQRSHWQGIEMAETRLARVRRAGQSRGLLVTDTCHD